MRGDYTELSIQRETVKDGCGGEIEGLVVRVWGEAASYADDRETLLVLEMRLPNYEPPIAMPMVRETIDHVLACLELEA